MREAELRLYTGSMAAPNKDTPCPHCGVLFAKGNLTLHQSACSVKGGKNPAGKTPKPAAASRSRAPRESAPPREDEPAAPPKKRDYDVLDSGTW